MNPYALNMPKPRPGRPEIGMAPLVDVVFLLLIFFMVTTIFPEHTGMQIEKPKSTQTAILEETRVVVSVDQSGGISFGNRRVGSGELAPLLKEAFRLHPDRMLLVKADRRARIETLVEVLDAGRSGGARQMGIATDEKTERE